jgi:hypothetical protein
MPAGALMRITTLLAAEDSIERAAVELRNSNASLLPVSLDGRLIGVVTEGSIATAIGAGIDLRDPVSDIMLAPHSVRSYMSGAEALRVLDQMLVPTLIVVDDHERVMGVVSPSDLVQHHEGGPKPLSIGGMATPFGVYLTNGSVGAGVNDFALMSTGFAMYTLLAIASLIVNPGLDWLQRAGVPDSWVLVASVALPMLLFLIFMRLIPLSGTHGSEHMVVHAIERGERLEPDVVRRMPRVHPRCGTNIAAGAGIFSGIMSIPGIDTQVKIIPVVLLTLYLWRPVGAFLQRFFTTKTPSKKQLEGGIRSGVELLDKFSKSQVSSPSVPRRIWRSGLLQVMLGASACAVIFQLIVFALNSFWNLGISI